MQSEQKLWVEKYRPLSLKDARAIHNETIPILEKLADSEDFPHVLFYGPSGGGKRTLTKGLLQAIFNT